MTRNRLVSLALAGALAAATASMASSSPVQPLSGKQARLQGLAPPPAAVREPAIARLIIKLRHAEADRAAAGARAVRINELAVTTGAELHHVRDLAGDASLVALRGALPLSQARALAARLAADPSVEYAEPDVMMRRLAIPNEPRFFEWQWNLFAPTSLYTGAMLDSSITKSEIATGGANLPVAWDLSGGGASAVVVAVIDTGINNHMDLNGVNMPAPYVPAGRFIAGYDFISHDVGAGDGLPPGFAENDGQPGRDPDPTDPGDWVTAIERTTYANSSCADLPLGGGASSWHGLHMSGIVGATANNGIGIAGIGWNVRVQPVRALGKCGGALSDIGEAIRWAAGLPVPGVPTNGTPAHVISLSLGGNEDCSPSMQSAVTDAIAAGSVVVAATGNDGDTALISPASCAGVIAVTAHTINGENADYANIAAATTISAPGGGSPVLVGAGGPTDDNNWNGYYIWSTLLFGPTTPDSANAQGQTGSAYGGFTGTSAATPHVAGVAALIKSVLPAATPAQIKEFIRSTARPYPAGSPCGPGGAFAGLCGAGLLDAAGALSSATVMAPPIITVVPQSQTVVQGQSATLSVAAAGAAPLTYQWKLNGVDIPGANGATYVTPPLGLADSGARFSVTVTNALGANTSSEAVVTVVPPPPSGGGGGGALRLDALLLLGALWLAARLRGRG